MLTALPDRLGLCGRNSMWRKLITFSAQIQALLVTAGGLATRRRTLGSRWSQRFRVTWALTRIVCGTGLYRFLSTGRPSSTKATTECWLVFYSACERDLRQSSTETKATNRTLNLFPRVSRNIGIEDRQVDACLTLQ